MIFADEAGAAVLRAPTKPKYVIYGVYVSGEKNVLTLAGMERYTYPAIVLDYIYDEVYGYKKAHYRYSRGLVIEPGYLYAVLADQWPETPTMTVEVIVHGISDLVL